MFLLILQSLLRNFETCIFVETDIVSYWKTPQCIGGGDGNRSLYTLEYNGDFASILCRAMYIYS